MRSRAKGLRRSSCTAFSSTAIIDVIARLSDERRCLAPDLLGHGDTPARADQDVSLRAEADALEAFCKAMGLDEVDVVANDSGSAIAQIFAARHPERIRTLTLSYDAAAAFSRWVVILR